jgi:elongation factor 1 alpha-like protein
MGDETSSQWAVAGDRVSITLSDIDPIKIHLGSVLCSPTNPVPTSSRFRASINTFDLDIPLTLGVPIVFHHLGAVEAGTIIAMEHSIEAGGREKKRPRVISSRSKATVVIQLERPISCQIFSISLELGRFLLRKGKISVGAGLIEELLQFQS